MSEMLNVQECVVSDTIAVDVGSTYYRELNNRLYELVQQGYKRFQLQNVLGQRYLGTSLQKAIDMDIHGVPGNDLGAFMDGPRINVLGNAQDGCGNTMNSGSIVIHGHAGDVLGLSMRGGEIFVQGNVGYRVGIHMKEYGDTRPLIVIGGTAQHFLGEYMAGGTLVVFGMNLEADQPHPSRYVGTGMHGGAIYLRGEIDDTFLGKEVGIVPLNEADTALIRQCAARYANYFDADLNEILDRPFIKLVPLTKRPYGQLYAY